MMVRKYCEINVIRSTWCDYLTISRNECTMYHMMWLCDDVIFESTVHQMRWYWDNVVKWKYYFQARSLLNPACSKWCVIETKRWIESTILIAPLNFSPDLYVQTPVNVTRPDTRLPQSRAGGQGPYLSSPEHSGRSSTVKEQKNIKKKYSVSGE